jgi:phosphoribosyl-ATP pyrophosphohydrolase
MLEKYFSFVRECMSWWDSDKNKDFKEIYLAAGLLEESWEIKQTFLIEQKNDYIKNVISESGDFLWYLVALFIIHDLSPKDIPESHVRERASSPTSLFDVSFNIHKRTLKQVFHDKEYELKKSDILCAMETLLCFLSVFKDVNLDIVIIENIKKIKSRYPQGRDTKHINKDVKKEISNMSNYG